MKIDIVTGFLGAGKTTFISGYIQYLKKQNEKIVIIENEFGLAGIDGNLLKNKELEVYEIAGGCVCCTQQPKLIRSIIEANRQGYDRIIFEPSGVYNLDTFFNLMKTPELVDICELNSIITIAKPDGLVHSSGAYKNILMSQFLSAGSIILSNTQSYTTDEINKTVLEICKFSKNFSSKFNIEQVSLYTKEWKDFTDDDYRQIEASGRTFFEHKAIFELHANVIDSVFVSSKLSNYECIKTLLDYLFSLKNAEVVRVKGYIKVDDKDIYIVNCTPECSSIEKCNSKHAVLNIMGKNLNHTEIEDKIKSLQSI